MLQHSVADVLLHCRHGHKVMLRNASILQSQWTVKEITILADVTTNSMVTASYSTVSMGHMQHKSGREEHGAASASILLQQIWHHLR